MTSWFTLSQQSGAALQTHLVHNISHTEMEQKTETGKTHILSIYHFQKCEANRGNVISSLLLPQPIACLHLIVNNCWQNLRKPRSGRPSSFVPSSSPSPRHITSFKNHWGAACWSAHTFLISYLSLLGVILWGCRADLLASTVQISTPESHLM